MNPLTFQAKVLDVSHDFGDQKLRAHLTFPGGFLILHEPDSLGLSIGQELEVTIAPRQDVLVTCEHGEEVESDGSDTSVQHLLSRINAMLEEEDEVESAGAGPAPDSQVGSEAHLENSPTPVATCKWCDLRFMRVRETLPNGEVIWVHCDRGVFHECKNVDGD